MSMIAQTTQDNLNKAYIDACGCFPVPLEKIERLLEAKADPFAQDSRGQNALHWAVSVNSPPLWSFLIQRYPDLVTMKDNSNKFPSHSSLAIKSHALQTLTAWYSENNMPFPFDSLTDVKYECEEFDSSTNTMRHYDCVEKDTHFHLLARFQSAQDIKTLVSHMFSLLDSQTARVRAAVKAVLPVLGVANLVASYVGDRDSILQMKNYDGKTAAEIAREREKPEDAIALLTPRVKREASGLTAS